MAHFALVNEITNIVENIIVIANDIVNEPELNFPDTEPVGQDYIKNQLLLDGVWKQCSYNNSFRRIYPEVGGWYSPELDVFYHPQPYPDWILTEDCKWVPPIPLPENGLPVGMARVHLPPDPNLTLEDMSNMQQYAWVKMIDQPTGNWYNVNFLN